MGQGSRERRGGRMLGRVEAECKGLSRRQCLLGTEGWSQSLDGRCAGEGERRGSGTHSLCLILSRGKPMQALQQRLAGSRARLDGPEWLGRGPQMAGGPAAGPGPGSGVYVVWAGSGVGLIQGWRGAEAKREGLELFPANRTWRLLRHRGGGQRSPGGPQVSD